MGEDREGKWAVLVVVGGQSQHRSMHISERSVVALNVDRPPLVDCRCWYDGITGSKQQVKLIEGHVGDAGQNDWWPAQSGEKKSVQRLVRMSRWMIAGVNESQGRRGQLGEEPQHLKCWQTCHQWGRRWQRQHWGRGYNSHPDTFVFNSRGTTQPASQCSSYDIQFLVVLQWQVSFPGQ